MSELLLHHFEASPYAEKVRLLLGYCSLEWASVRIPRILPKPYYLALTGGYRKTPTLQIGRDLYCDTALITRVIAARAGYTETLLPADRAVEIVALEALGDRLFLAAIPVLFRPEGRAALVEKLGEEGLAKFQADRAELFSGGSVSLPDEQLSRALWAPGLARLEAQLTPRPFLLGEMPTLADFALYHPIWYVRSNPGVAASIDGHPRLLEWFAQMSAFGRVERHELSEAHAHDVAAACTQWQPLAGEHDPSLGFDPGSTVNVHARDYGVECTSGRLVQLSRDTISLERHAEFEGSTIGPVRVHFPRDGFVIEPA
ncbi:glutathione S-transferase family protein [Kushneria aurantia]|uniref:Glutathione S-transferase family protein n=1 Tax=Kushneria aurantia TaxID=504092 RepID=A0ABV6G7R3_9GAMM|nr:glutathione S-transferase family protein [Kushneria aurantia]